jgi:hypothetical protein
MAEFCRRVMQLNFVADRDIDSAECICEVLGQLGLPAREIIEEAQDDANQLRLRHQTDTAKAKGVFGAPQAGMAEGRWISTVAERLDLDGALATLPPDARLCVVLAYSEGMSHAEISDTTAIPLGTVKSHRGWTVSMLVGAWVLLRTRPSRG